MLRMEIALFLILAFVAYIYFSAKRERTPLHHTFSLLLVTVLVHLAFDAATVYTVNRLDTVPPVLNNVLHRLFIGTMLLVVYLFYQYIAILVEEEAGSPRRMDLAARIYLAVSELGVLVVLPVRYTQTPQGNYSSGIHASVCYASVGFYLLLCAGLLVCHWRSISHRKKFAIGAALLIEFSVCILQGFNPTWLISGMGITLMTLSFYLTLENPDILRGELVEQKMSMLYLKSQVNPHFLYNTLDAIRIQAQLDGDRKVADLLMRLVDFFRRSVKVDQPMVPLEDELELLEAYLDLMCYRYPELCCRYDIDPALYEAMVPTEGGAVSAARRQPAGAGRGASHHRSDPLFADPSGGGHQTEPAGGGIPSQRTLYQPTVQKRDRRQFSHLSDQHPHGAGAEAAAVYLTARRRGIPAVRLRRLPRVYKSLQEIRGGHPVPVPQGLSGERNMIPTACRPARHVLFCLFFNFDTFACKSCLSAEAAVRYNSTMIKKRTQRRVYHEKETIPFHGKQGHCRRLRRDRRVF